MLGSSALRSRPSVGPADGGAATFDETRFARWMRMFLVAFYSDEEAVVVDQLIRRSAQVRDMVLAQAVGLPMHQVRQALERRLVPDGVLDRETEGVTTMKTFYRISPHVLMLTSARLQKVEDTLTAKAGDEFSCPACGEDYDSLRAMSRGFKCEKCDDVQLEGGDNLRQDRLTRFRKQCRDLLILTRELKDMPVPYFGREERARDKPAPAAITVGSKSPDGEGAASTPGGEAPASGGGAPSAPPGVDAVAPPAAPQPAAPQTLGAGALQEASAPQDYEWFHKEVLLSVPAPDRPASMDYRREGAEAVDDSSCWIQFMFSVQEDRFSQLKSSYPGFYKAVNPKADRPLQYGFSYSEEFSLVCWRQGFKDATGALGHLRRVEGKLKEVQSLVSISTVEAYGPEVELSRLKEVLAQYGCRFFVAKPGCKLFSVREPASWGFYGADTSCVLFLKFGALGGDLGAVRDRLKGFDESMKPETEGTLFHGFVVDEASKVVLCCGSYNDAAGVLAHMKNTNDNFRALLEVADLTSLEVHGPAGELTKLRGTLQPLGCKLKFFASDAGCRTWFAPREVLLVRQAQGILQKDLVQRRLAERLRSVAGEEGLQEGLPAKVATAGEIAAVTSLQGRGLPSPAAAGEQAVADPAITVQGVPHPLSRIRGDETLQDKMNDEEYERFVEFDRQVRRRMTGHGFLS